MHELGVTFYVCKEVDKVAKENNVKHVNSVTIELGEVSTVIPYQLIDCWNWAKKKYPVLEETELRINRLDAVTFCEDCEKEYPTVKYGKKCPHCGSEKTYLLRGNEFSIKEIEVLDE